MDTISDIARCASHDRSAIHSSLRGDRKPGERKGTSPSLLRTRESQNMRHLPAQQVLTITLAGQEITAIPDLTKYARHGLEALTH